jgi:Uma2 family endonuclease
MNANAQTPSEWPPYLKPPPSMAELMRHAAETDEGMESENHAIQADLLKNSLGHRFKDRPDVYIGANVPLYFSALQLKRADFRVPDIMVVLDAEPSTERPFWVVWNEGGRVPNVIIELLSPSTIEADRVTKHRIYSKVLGVPEYFLFDVDRGVLEGFRLDDPKDYVPIAPDANGRLPTHQLDGAFGTVLHTAKGRERTWMRLFDREGRLVPTLEEAERERAEAERERAEAERLRAEALAAKLAEYAARFGPLE